MYRRIGTQVIVGVGLVTAVTIGLMAAVIIRAHRAELIAQLTHGADQLSETVKSSTHEYMLENRREALQRQVEAIGAQTGIEKVRLFNKEGRIAFSSDRAEIDRVLDKRAEACYVCHAEGKPLERPSIQERARIFRGADGQRVLGIVNPILNQPGCWSASCHAHGPRETVLGVLDVTMPLAEVDRQISQSQARMAGLALVAIIASGLLIFRLNRRLVVLPVRALAAGTRRVAEG
ncbi:MAG TPA: two-component sensor histidine kinase, partial [Candidatus Polarisedimenticolia bacterium]|nr:two-component sensor histidine kinase [Candidatus Polarisedimenticolia bacterium]